MNRGFLRFFDRALCLDNDGGRGGGATTDDDKGGQPNNEPDPNQPDPNGDGIAAGVDPENETMVRSFIAQQANSMVAVQNLLKENRELRHQRNRARQQAQENEEKAKKLDQYAELGEPEEVQGKLEEHGTMKAEAEERKQLSHYDKTAQMLDWDPEAFREIVKPLGLEIEHRVVGEEDDEKKQKPYVRLKTTNDDGEETTERVPVETYFEQNKPWALPALKPGENTTQEEGQQRRRYGRQSSDNGGDNTKTKEQDLGKDVNAQRYAPKGTN